MSIDLYWDDDEQTVMLCEFNGAWTWAELQAVLKTIKRISGERERVLGAIVDVRNGMSIPGGSIFNHEALGQFKQMTRLGSDGKGPVAVVGVNGIIRGIIEAVRNVDKNAVKDVYCVDTMQAAQETIYAAMQRLDHAATS